MLKLNILTAKVGEEAEKPVSITITDFWISYLRMLFLIEQKINAREEQVLAYIFSNNPEYNHFAAPHSTRMMNELGFSNRSEITRLKKSLVEKKLIKEEDFTPVDKLKAVHNVVVQTKKISFIFSYELI